jgi:hypothetical protein
VHRLRVALRRARKGALAAASGRQSNNPSSRRQRLHGILSTQSHKASRKRPEDPGDNALTWGFTWR